MLNPIGLLVVDDDPDDYELTIRLLAEARTIDVDVSWSRTATGAIEELESGRHDVCMLDYAVGAVDGLDLVRRARATGSRLPIIFVTDDGGRGTDLDALAAGATSYLVKSEMTADLLERTIRYCYEHHRLLREIETRAQLELQLKNRFVSRVSNELKLPLGSIRRLVAMVLDGTAGDTNPEQVIYLRKALKNVHQLGSTIDALLEVTLAESRKLVVTSHPMSLSDVCEEVIESFEHTARASSIELSTTLPDDLPRVFADAHRVRQVLERLVENALKFSKEGGVVRLGAVTDSARESVRIDVTDTGAGVVPEVQERIFDRLYREAGTEDVGVPGLGLGLYLCRQIVERLGGRIWVESIPGEGSTFSFTLPTARRDASIVGTPDDRG